MADPADEIESELIDLTDLTLEQVRSLGESAIGTAVRRVITEAQDHQEPLAGFSSRI